MLSTPAAPLQGMKCTGCPSTSSRHRHTDTLCECTAIPTQLKAHLRHRQYASQIKVAWANKQQMARTVVIFDIKVYPSRIPARCQTQADARRANLPSAACMPLYGPSAAARAGRSGLVHLWLITLGQDYRGARRLQQIYRQLHQLIVLAQDS